jgi:hypothetical protein
VAEAFDKVWHEGLCHKIEMLLPSEFSQLLQSYLTDRYCRVKQKHKYSGLKAHQGWSAQKSVLGLVLNLIYTSDLSMQRELQWRLLLMTAIMAVGDDVGEATDKLQRAADKINWTKQRLIKLDEDKSIHVNFTSNRCRHIPIITNGKTIPYSHTVKYLGMTLDAKLRWKLRVKKKREELGLKYKKMYWLMGRRS